jgi:DNA polymerase III alpha subunit
LSGRYLEDLGFLKFDILGIGTLRMFENCIRRILQRHKGIKYPTFKQIKEFFYLNVHPDNNRMNDQKVFKHVFWEGNYFNIFQFVQKNTQTFMSQMKPTSVLDIAIATSIYRPGPLAIKVNELYLNNLKHPENIQYKHPLLKEVLGETAGLIVFQEQLQLIYHKLAGIPLDETDLIRKAFTKKDLSNKEKSEKDREKLREDFRELCLKNNNIDPSVSYSIFDEMEKFVSYSFNKSHALTYATTSYICSWFLTYYPDEWIAAGLDYCSQDKGKASGKEDPQVVAMAEARKLGFTFSKPDINKSAFGFELDSSNAKVIIPGFASLKHVGKSALWEIDKFRPYTRLEDLLINSDGTWRHSKFNKRSLSTLIKLEALESLGLVGEGKTFRNYKEMHNILVDEYDQLKRISARKKNNNVLEALNKMIEDSRNKDCPDWSQEEKVAFCSELSGTVDIDLLISKETRERLEKLKIDSLDQYPYSEDEYQKQPASPHWAIIKNASLVNSKSGASTYLMIKAFAESGEEYRINIWRWNEAINHLKPNAVISAVFTYDKKYDSFTCPRGTLCLISGD